MIKGIDISHWQGEMNFDDLKNIVKFIIMKATEGVAYTDTKLKRNQSEARRVGIPLGYYHFARPEYGNSAEAEAQYFINKIGDLQDGEILVLDYESPWNGDVITWCYQFLNKVFSLTKVRPLIYLNQSLMNNYNWTKIINENFGLWLAKYDENSSIPATPWPTLAMKQFTNALPILDKKVDGDYFYGSVEVFKKYGYSKIDIVTPTEPELNDAEKAMETLMAYKISEEHSNLQGAINDLIGKAKDLIIANKKIDELDKKILELTTENGVNSKLLIVCQKDLEIANKKDDIVEENSDTVSDTVTQEEALNILQKIIGFIKNLLVKK
jgi:GH25 family lysozyme M1 (1,4-beta-N-acetylmuramidase)